jgi:hypothetical protein
MLKKGARFDRYFIYSADGMALWLQSLSAHIPEDFYEEHKKYVG